MPPALIPCQWGGSHERPCQERGEAAAPEGGGNKEEGLHDSTHWRGTKNYDNSSGGGRSAAQACCGLTRQALLGGVVGAAALCSPSSTSKSVSWFSVITTSSCNSARPVRLVPFCFRHHTRSPTPQARRRPLTHPSPCSAVG